MSKHGIAYPEIIDLVVSNDKECILIIVQDEYLAKEDTLALQKKIKNYLSYGLDGQLSREYPDCIDKRLVIQIDLCHTPDAFVFEFIEKARSAAESEGVSLTIKMIGA